MLLLLIYFLDPVPTCSPLHVDYLLLLGISVQLNFLHNEFVACFSFSSASSSSWCSALFICNIFTINHTAWVGFIHKDPNTLLHESLSSKPGGVVNHYCLLRIKFPAHRFAVCQWWQAGCPLYSGKFLTLDAPALTTHSYHLLVACQTAFFK